MKLKLVMWLLAAVAIVAGQTPASAQKWTGCYIGVSAGMATTVTKADLDSSGPWPPPGNVLSIDGLGQAGGAIGPTGGCDMQIDRFVVGVMGSYLWHNGSFEVSSGLLPGTVLSFDLDTQWDVAGRAGILFTDKTLVYGLVGYTRLDTTGLNIPIAATTLSVPTFEGWQFGGGIETEIMPNVRLAAEYRYTHFDAQPVALGAGIPVNLNLQPDMHVAMARLSYAFPFLSAK